MEVDSSECSDSDSNAENIPSSSKYKKLALPYKKNKQKYKKIWEKEFPGWLSKGRSEYEAFCKCCNTNISSQLHIIRNHSKCASHSKQLRVASGKVEISTYFSPKDQSLEDNIKKAELKLAAFIAEHNIAFLAVDHLTVVLQQCFPDSKIANGIKLGRTKCTALVKNVIGYEYKINLAHKLKNTKFSILTDESTDISSEKTSCIVVRYFDSDTKRVVSSFWELSQVFSAEAIVNEGATANNLFLNIKSSIDKFNIPYENIVGFGSDGCNVMMGEHNSVASRFQELCPGISIMKCVCHSAHLVASEACKSLPRRCEDLARNVYNYINGSAKRMHSLKQFQQFLDINVHRILHPSQTRWLSLRAVVVRLVEQWDALKLFFNEQWLADRLVVAETICKDLNDPFLKLHFYFLEWILPKFTIFNQYFQSDKVIITDLNDKVSDLYKEILLTYMNRKYITQNDLATIIPTNQEEFLHKRSMYLGIKVMQELKNLSTNHLNEFYDYCQKFLIISCCEIKKRFSFDDPKLKLLSYFRPDKALSETTRVLLPTLLPLFEAYPRLVSDDKIKEEIDRLWRKLSDVTFPAIILTEKAPDIFWATILTHDNGHDEKEFAALAQFVLDILVYPHSNAECERVFSKVNLIKTKIRNRMVTETVNGVLLSSASIKQSGGCTKFDTTLFCKKVNKSMYESSDDGDCDIFDL